MIFPRKVTYSLLMILVLGTLIYRYPLEIGHETGSDTTFIHTLSNSLVDQGRAVWILHPTSYFGLYALSYPSGMPFMLASISQTSGAPIEGAMLLSGFVFGVVGALGAFTAARSVRRDERFAFVVALLFSIAPFYLKETTWIGSSRGFVTSLVPALFLVLLLHHKRSDIKLLFVALLLVFAMSALHRMGTLTLFVLIAYGFAIPFHRVTQKLRFALARYESPFRFASAGTAAAGFFGLLYVQFLFPGIAGPNVVDEYGTGTFLSGSSFLVLLANMAISLTGKAGVLLPLAMVGIARAVWKRPKDDRDKFLLVAAFVIIPLLSLRDYISEFVVFMFVIFIGIAFFPKSGPVLRRKLASAATLTVLLCGALAFSWVMKDYWRDQYYTDGAMSDETYAVALYARWQTDANLVSNEGMAAGRVAAIADRPVLPVGGASIHWYGPQQLTFGMVRADTVHARQIPLTSISFQTDEIFVPIGVNITKDEYERIFYNPYGSDASTRTLDSYDLQYLLLMNSRPNSFQSYIWRDSPFLVGARVQTYKIYDSGASSLWFIP